MLDVVLDASAVLALLNDEPGADQVWPHLPGAHLSAVNAAEVVAKLVDAGLEVEAAAQALNRLGLRIEPFGADDILPAARIRAVTRSTGLSLGDRACLALASRLQVPALTADREWRRLKIGVEVRQIRGD